MNNVLTFAKVLSGINKSLTLAREIIPIYNQTKPLFKNAKTIYNSFSKKVPKPVIRQNKTPIQKKITTNNSNNPTFFI